MPAKITNPLMEGLPSKIYLCAFPAPKSRYQIAREIYNIPKGQIPPTAKVSNAVRDMLSEKYGKKYLIETPNGILSDVTPLLAEIEKDLEEHRKIKITDAEKFDLTNFLNNQFRASVANIVPPKGDVNVYYILKNNIGGIVYAKKFFTSIDLDDSEFKKFLKCFIPETEEEGWKELKEMWKELKKIPLSNPLLEKLEVFAPEELVKTTELAKGIGTIFFKGISKLAETCRK